MNIKKITVSAVVITSFVAYSAYQRLFGIANPVISPTSPATSIDQSQQIQIIPTPVATTDLPTIKPIERPTPSRLPAATLVPSPIPTPIPTPTPTSMYKDGNYTGDAADAFYGNIQVQATISNGRLTKVLFLQYPNDRSHSIEINNYADPILAQEAISAQSANVDAVSGATDSSQAFVQSLQSALAKAKN